MQNYQILWADDEIDLLKPHILFLEAKGFVVNPVASGTDALDALQHTKPDLVFLDENMPGMTGLETLQQIKENWPNLPVVMITKSEEEQIMENAIGSKIADYLIKPLNPNQILLSAKKILENRRLVSEKTNLSYQQDFRNLSQAFNDNLSHQEWAEIYKKLVYWELEIDQTMNRSMAEVIYMQKEDANNNFARFIGRNYEDWLNNPGEDAPLMSHQLMRKKVLPKLGDSGASVFFILIDNLRYDQFKLLQQDLEATFSIQEESLYYSILPTTTAFARNAIFSGLLPSEIQKKYPQYWVEDNDDEEGKNNYEDKLLGEQLKRLRAEVKFSYNKILTTQQGKDLVGQVNNLMANRLNVIVYNFVDMLSHARTDMAMIKELAPDESAYRSLTRSWFQHSPLRDILQKVAEKGGRVVLTTDHGTVRVKTPFKIVGDRSVNTNLRYKHGRNLGFDDSDAVLVCRKPERFFLPKQNVSTAYVFTNGDYFFAYPNNYNHYASHFRDTFQHGGISLEEVIIPYIELLPK